MKKTLNTTTSTKKIFSEPGKALSNFLLQFIEKYFTLSFIVLFVLSGLSFYAGFIENIIFFQITFFFFITILIASALVFYRIKKEIKYIAQRLDTGVKNVIERSTHNIVDVDVEE